jgi:hypothetical protein
MKTTAIQSVVNGVDQRQRYRYLLLDQIYRDSWCNPIDWEAVPKEGSGELFYSQRRHKDTGDTITCQGVADGTHVFTWTQADIGKLINEGTK